jgi:DNA-binding GntR family transcriptional regulator
VTSEAATGNRAPHRANGAAQRVRRKGGGAIGTAARSLPAQVADRLRQDIVAGTLAPGERLTEIALAEQHAVSRATIREALAQLERQRFVERLPRHGARVAQLGVEAFLELYEFRSALLGVAARRAAQRATREGLAELDRRVALLEALAHRDSTPATSYSDHALAIQSCILAMSRGRWISDIYDQMGELTLWRAVLRKRALSFSTPERRRGSARDYRRLAKAIMERDPAAAEAAARALIDASARFIRDRLVGEEGRAVQASAPGDAS